MKKKKKFRNSDLLLCVSMMMAIGSATSLLLMNNKDNTPEKLYGTDSGYLVENKDGSHDFFIKDTNYFTKEDAVKDYSQFCYQIGQETENFPSTQNTLNTIKEISGSGENLYNLAEQESIFFCRNNSSFNNAKAVYESFSDSVHFSHFDIKNSNLISTTAHEIGHAEQDYRGVNSAKNNWDLKSIMRLNFAIEASAVVSEVILAFEAKNLGNEVLWNNLNSGTISLAIDKNDPMLKSFSNKYEEKISEGESHKVAIEAAGEVAWTHVLKNKKWVEAYSNQGLRHYNRIAILDQPDLKKLTTNMPSNEQISELGNIGGYHFGKNLTIDSFTFKDGTDVFDYASNYVHERMSKAELKRHEKIEQNKSRVVAKPVPVIEGLGS